MMAWLIFLMTAVAETFVNISFYDIFLEQKWEGNKRITGYLALYVSSIVNAVVTETIFPTLILWKAITIIALNVLYVKIWCRAEWPVSAFFAMQSNTLFPLFGFVVFNILGYAFGSNRIIVNLWELAICLIWIGVLSVLHRKLPFVKQYLRCSGRVTLTLGLFPILALVAAMYFYYLFVSGSVGGMLGSFVAAGLVIINIVSLFMLQESLIKDEKLRLSEIQNESKQNQLQAFHDMHSLYERQGQKLHDYKKQLATLQGLMKNGNIDTAIELTEQLTKSIAVEVSEINVGHPIINAILNQQYRVAKGKSIGMSFAISDLKDVNISDEDIVVMLGNLIENAIHECEEVVAQGRAASISIKFVEKDGRVILNIRNPVRKKVEIADNKVVSLSRGGHGIGLSNVEEVTERNGGTYAISCDEKEFVAVVVI